MKRNSTPTLRVVFEGLDAARVARVVFLFKRRISESEPALLRKDWPGGDVRLTDGAYCVCFSLEDTRRLPEGVVYMDTLVEMDNGAVPPTGIVRLTVSPTLFGEVCVHG